MGFICHQMQKNNSEKNHKNFIQRTFKGFKSDSESNYATTIGFVGQNRFVKRFVSLKVENGRPRSFWTNAQESTNLRRSARSNCLQLFGPLNREVKIRKKGWLVGKHALPHVRNRKLTEWYWSDATKIIRLNRFVRKQTLLIFFASESTKFATVFKVKI